MSVFTRSHMWLVFYSIISALIFPFYVMHFCWHFRRTRRAAYVQLLERLSIKFRFNRSVAPCVWIYAASVGESRAAEPLIRLLKNKRPDLSILVTNATMTGYETASKLFGDSVFFSFIPYDLPWFVNRFLSHWQPVLCLLMETEIWPNLLASCSKVSVPVVLVNGRLSRKSCTRYLKFSGLFQPCFDRLALVLAQSEGDAKRFSLCGAKCIEVMGQLKYDQSIDYSLVHQGQHWRRALSGRLILLLASTRQGEEEDFLNACEHIALPHNLLVVIVPRHPERFQLVFEIASKKMPTGRRSEGLPTLTDRFWIGDSIGEMSAYYAMADMAIIGGGFRPFGGQNFIEACAVGCPVVCGPHMFNFSEVTRWALEAGVLFCMPDPAAAIQLALDTINDPPVRDKLSQLCFDFVETQRGGGVKAVDRIIQMIPESL